MNDFAPVPKFNPRRKTPKKSEELNREVVASELQFFKRNDSQFIHIDEDYVRISYGAACRVFERQIIEFLKQESSGYSFTQFIERETMMQRELIEHFIGDGVILLVDGAGVKCKGLILHNGLANDVFMAANPKVVSENLKTFIAENKTITVCGCSNHGKTLLSYAMAKTLSKTYTDITLAVDEHADVCNLKSEFVSANNILIIDVNLAPALLGVGYHNRAFISTVLKHGTPVSVEGFFKIALYELSPGKIYIYKDGDTYRLIYSTSEHGLIVEAISHDQLLPW